MSSQPFRPTPGATVLIDVGAGSARVAVRPANSIRIMNNGSATAWVNFGDATVTASLTTSFPVGPGVTEVVRYSNKDGSPLYASAIAAGATGKIYFTPGDGM